MTEGNRFDEAAGTWDEAPHRVQMAAAVADEIRVRAPLSPALDVLDFGCGTGLLTLALQPLVRTVTGADTSTAMLDVLRAKARDRRLANVATLLLERDGPPALAPAHADLIVSSMALHHVRDLAPTLRAFFEHLRAGGRVALADLDREDGTFHDDARDLFHLGFDRAEMKALLADAGFAEPVATTATVVRKNDREYPIFLFTGTKHPRA